ncbi:MAG: MqnA/MqnD/SBP family protein [Candidatus Zixiibacteriota bacterium]
MKSETQRSGDSGNSAVSELKRTIRLGHSPDPDDAFMFYALARDLIDTESFEFEHVLADIETLNQRAERGELEITAVSIHAYPGISDTYALLGSGGSMGDNYGPLVVAKSAILEKDLNNVRIAVPGIKTSAFLALTLAIGKFEHTVLPFDQILEAVSSGSVDAGLIIHEGQLTYSSGGLRSILDLGVWWNQRTGGLPLPLGGNCVRRDLGAENIKSLSRILRESIRYSLDHRPEAVEYALQYGRGLDSELADKFIGMYVNDYTLDYGPKGRAAIQRFLSEGAEAGLISGSYSLEFV